MSSTRILADDSLVSFADLQTGLADLPLTMKPDELKKGVLALAKLAKLFNIRAMVTAVPGADGAPRIMPRAGKAANAGRRISHFNRILQGAS